VLRLEGPPAYSRPLVGFRLAVPRKSKGKTFDATGPTWGPEWSWTNNPPLAVFCPFTKLSWEPCSNFTSYFIWASAVLLYTHFPAAFPLGMLGLPTSLVPLPKSAARFFFFFSVHPNTGLRPSRPWVATAREWHPELRTFRTTTAMGPAPITAKDYKLEEFFP